MYRAVLTLLVGLMLSLGGGVSAFAKGEVIWDGIQIDRVSGDTVKLQLTTEGIFWDGKFKRARNLPKKFACIYGLGGFPEKTAFVVRSESMWSRTWTMALDKFDFHECVMERLRAASVYKFEEALLRNPDNTDATKKRRASLNKTTVAPNLVCKRETSHKSELGSKKQFNQIFPEQFKHPAHNVLKFGKKLRLIEVASGHFTSLGRLDFILLPNKDLIISVTQNNGNPGRVKYSCNKSPDQILQLANSTQTMPSVEANQSSNVIEEKDAKQAFERGLAKAQRQDYFAAFEIWKVAADRGHGPSATSLAELYLYGLGVQEDISKAIKYLTIAADSGHTRAKSLLGSIYYWGQKVQKNYAVAIPLLMEAGKDGDAEAQADLSDAYALGNGVLKDEDLAFYWAERSAFNGSAHGALLVGWLYRRGQGVKPNYKKAMAYFEKAYSSNENFRAALNIAELFAAGLGVPQNKEVALKWLSKALTTAKVQDHSAVESIQQRIQSIETASLKALAWQGRNDDWFGTNEEMTNFATNVHSRLAENGNVIIDSVEYYEALDTAVRSRFPLYFSGRTKVPDKSQIANTKVTSATNKTAELEAEQKRRINAEAELAALKAQQAEHQKVISNDNQAPLLKIMQSGANGREGYLTGSVKDNVQVAEVLVDGSAVNVGSDGSFEWTGFVPAMGKEIIVEAIDTAALSSRQIVRIERSQTPQKGILRFDELNPMSGKIAKANQNALALIVGISEYDRTNAPAIFADNDAQFFQDYAALKLGISENNITTLVNGNAEQVDVLLSVKNWLSRAVRQNQSDVYIFFAGHGLASDDGEKMYLLPYDGAPELLEDTAVSRDRLFSEIATANPRSVTVFLDTCYSGTTRGPDMLIASRPIAIRAKEQAVPEGFTVMTAAAGDQTAKPLEEAKHGMFSYFLMKGMEGDADANQDNQITAGELHAYVQQNVIQQSSGSQTPELQGDVDRVLVRFQ